MSAIKIIAIDIDATLLNSNHQLTNTVKNAIKSASEKGIKVVLTSGRPISGIRPFLKQLDLDDRNDQYVISFGGGVVETTSGRITLTCKTLRQNLDCIFMSNHQKGFLRPIEILENTRLLRAIWSIFQFVSVCRTNYAMKRCSKQCTLTIQKELKKLLNTKNFSINLVTGSPLREALRCIMKRTRKARTRAALYRF